MLFPDHLTIIRGGGDLATGVAYRLHQAGFPLIVLELPQPTVIRREVALATAVFQHTIHIESLHGQRADSLDDALTLAHDGVIPVLVAPDLSVFNAPHPSTDHQPPTTNHRPPILIDGRIAKRNIDTTIDQADLVIGLGPGFTAGVDCHAVVETMRGHTLGRVIWEGTALPNTGAPGVVAGKGAERVLRAPVAGSVDWRLEIGDLVQAGEVMGEVAGQAVTAPFAGVVRGLLAPGLPVQPGMKIGDVDARGDVDACFTISDKALAVGGGVLEAILTWLNRQT